MILAETLVNKRQPFMTCAGYKTEAGNGWTRGRAVGGTVYGQAVMLGSPRAGIGSHVEE